VRGVLTLCLSGVRDQNARWIVTMSKHNLFPNPLQLSAELSALMAEKLDGKRADLGFTISDIPPSNSLSRCVFCRADVAVCTLSNGREYDAQLRWQDGIRSVIITTPHACPASRRYARQAAESEDR